MVTPIGIGSIDARRLVLDRLLEGLPGDLGIVPGRVRVDASDLTELAGRLAASMRGGDAPGRVSVVADVPVGVCVGHVTSFLGYVGGAASVEIVEVDAIGDVETARAIHAIGAVPYFRDDPARLVDLRSMLGAAVGLLAEPTEVMTLCDHDLPVRITGQTEVAGGPAGVMNLIGTVALLVDGVDGARELLEEQDRTELVLERRRLRWRARSIGIPALRAARRRFDGIRAPVDVSALRLDGMP